MRTVISSVGAAAFALLYAASAHADLVTNGGFETGSFSGWTLSGSLGITAVAPINPYAGIYDALLSTGGSSGFLSQTIGTTAGDTYQISFYLANSIGVPNSFSVSFDGTTGLSLTNVGAQPYTNYTFDVTAKDTSALLQFQYQDPFYFNLDNVTVALIGGGNQGGNDPGVGDPPTRVPEPTALALMASGLIGFGVLRRRRLV